MTNKREVGGKGAGLEWLAQNTDLGFEVPEFDEIGVENFNPILQQYLVGKLTSILTGSVSSVNRLPKEFDSVIQELVAKYEERPIIVRSNSFLEDGDTVYPLAFCFSLYWLRCC